MSRLTHSLCLLLLIAAGLPAQAINYPSFPSANGVSLQSSARVEGGALRLTDGMANQVGAVWHGTPVLVGLGFDTTFTFSITPSATTGRSEGLAFVLQNAIEGPNAIGLGGSALGYGGDVLGGAIRNALAIEIVDSERDAAIGDTSANEVSVHSGGSGACRQEEAWSIARATPPLVVADGNLHVARIQYVPGTLSIYLDDLNAPVLTVPYDLLAGARQLTGLAPGGLSLPTGTAWLGFTSATSLATAGDGVRIHSWTCIGSPSPDPCYTGNVGATVGPPVDVLFVDGWAGDFNRTVTRSGGGSLDISIIPPPGQAAAPFALAMAGMPPTTPFATGFGDMCFDPFTAGFLVAVSFPVPGALFAPGPAPARLTVPWMSGVVSEIWFQGVIADQTAPSGLAVTNCVRLRAVGEGLFSLGRLVPDSPDVGTIVEVLGTGMHPAVVLVLDGQPVPIIAQGRDFLRFRWPANLPCDAILYAQNPDGRVAQMVVNSTPVATSLSPQSGPATGSTLVYLNGTGLTSGTTVTINGQAVPVSFIGPTAIRFRTPPGIAGPATVVLTSPSGCTSSTTFLYL